MHHKHAWCLEACTGGEKNKIWAFQNVTTQTFIILNGVKIMVRNQTFIEQNKRSERVALEYMIKILKHHSTMCTTITQQKGRIHVDVVHRVNFPWKATYHTKNLPFNEFNLLGNINLPKREECIGSRGDKGPEDIRRKRLITNHQ